MLNEAQIQVVIHDEAISKQELNISSVDNSITAIAKEQNNLLSDLQMQHRDGESAHQEQSQNIHCDYTTSTEDCEVKFYDKGIQNNDDIFGVQEINFQ